MLIGRDATGHPPWVEAASGETRGGRRGPDLGGWPGGLCPGVGMAMGQRREPGLNEAS